MSVDSVQLIFKIQTENAAALGSLRQAVSGVNAELDKGNKITATLAKNNEGLVVTLKSVSGAANDAAGGQSKHNQSMSDGVLKGILYSEILNKVAQGLKAVTIESALYAARTEQLNTVMDQLARVNNLSVHAVRQQADAVKAQGITTQESREVISRMIFAQLDLTKATDLARLSQNAAKIAGISSSEALQGIINGIIEQRVQILRTYGIQVSFEQALIRGAAALHKTRQTLTDYERANIALNEVLSKGPRIAGAYEVSLTTAAGQMQSLKRYTDEAKNALGEGFLPILQKVIQFLTDSTHSVQDNAEAYQQLALHITSVGLALTAAKLTPGGPIPKAIVGVGVGVAAEVLGNTDAVEEATKVSSAAIEHVQRQRQLLIAKFNTGNKEQQELAIKEDQRLKELQITIEQNYTESLARIYKRRQEDYLQTFGKGIGPGAEQTTKEVRDLLRTDSGNKNIVPEKFDLGQGFSITREQLKTAIGELGKPYGTLDTAGLKITPDPAVQFDSMLGQFTPKIKEALKTTESALDHARASLLSGSEKIEAERRAALNKLAEDFKVFNDTFKATLANADTIKDPKQRQQLIDSVRSAQAQYGVAAGRVNQQYNLQLEKDRRDDAIKEIQREKKLGDTRFDIDIQQSKQVSAGQLRVARAGQTPGAEQKEILKTYQDRLRLASQERSEAKQKNQADLDEAQKIYALNQEDQKLQDAKNAFTIAELKAEAELVKENLSARTDKEVAILELRKKERQELQASFGIVQEIVKEEGKLDIRRTQDAAERVVKLATAQAATPVDQQYAAQLGTQQRLNAAMQEFEQAKETRAERQKAAYDDYAATANKATLEKTMGDLRKEELQSAYDLEKAIIESRLDGEIQIAEIRKTQDEQTRQLLGKFYEDLGVKGRGPKFFFQDMLDDLKKQLFTNAGSIVFQGALQKIGGIIPNQQQIDPATGKPTGQLTTLGKILQGTVLGVDPAKLVQQQQQRATERNTKALEDLTAALTGTGSSTTAASAGGIGNNPGSWGGWSSGSGGGGGGIFGKILGTLFGGLSSAAGGGGIAGGSSPYIFHGLPNLSGVGATPDIGSLIGLAPLLLGGAGRGSSANTGTLQTAALRSVFQNVPSLTGPGGIFGAKSDTVFNSDTGQMETHGVFSAGQTGLAAATALPQVIGGFKQGGAGGIMSGIGGILGAAASIPGPQQPFLAAGAAILTLLGPLFGANRYAQWKKKLDNRLASKFQTPEAINLTQDLAGNSADFDFMGNLRTYSGYPSTNLSAPNVHVAVSTLDARSFMDHGSMFADAVKDQLGLGHPLLKTIQDGVGA